ncbi:MAG: siphovirus Gp157 family protein, partial [Fusobacterium sp.]
LKLIFVDNICEYFIGIISIPKEYLVIKEEKAPLKTLIKDSLKKNIAVSGAILKEDYSLLLK